MINKLCAIKCVKLFMCRFVMRDNKELLIKSTQTLRRLLLLNESRMKN